MRRVVPCEQTKSTVLLQIMPINGMEQEGKCVIAGGNRQIRDSANDRFGERMRVHKDHKAGYSEVNYTSGHTLHWQKTDEGDGKKGKDHRLKEVRTLIRVDSPHEVWLTNAGEGDYGDKYDRIFRKGKYAEGEEGESK